VIAARTPVEALAAKRATSSIPIVFAVGSDPIRDGLVERWSCRHSRASASRALRNGEPALVLAHDRQMGVGRAERT